MTIVCHMRFLVTRSMSFNKHILLCDNIVCVCVLMNKLHQFYRNILNMHYLLPPHQLVQLILQQDGGQLVTTIEVDMGHM